MSENIERRGEGMEERGIPTYFQLDKNIKETCISYATVPG